MPRKKKAEINLDSLMAELTPFGSEEKKTKPGRKKSATTDAKEKKQPPKLESPPILQRKKRPPKPVIPKRVRRPIPMRVNENSKYAQSMRLAKLKRAATAAEKVVADEEIKARKNLAVAVDISDLRKKRDDLKAQVAKIEKENLLGS